MDREENVDSVFGLVWKAYTEALHNNVCVCVYTHTNNIAHIIYNVYKIFL